MKLTALGLNVGILLGATVVGAGAPGVPAEKPAGTGIIVHADGYILTAYHVVSDARRITVVTPGEFRAPALLVSADRENDLALLKIETVGLSEAPVGYASAVKLDQEVVVVGFPFGLREVSVSHGRVAAVRTKRVKHVFQLDAAINPGNSGGPVFNLRGEVVGIVTTKFSHPSGITPEGMGFAVPISYAMPLLANIPEFDFTAIGKGVREPKKGMEAGDLVREMARMTVRIETVRAPKAAAVRQGQSEPSPAKMNEQLVAEQQDALRKLEQRGILPLEGMVLIPEGEFVMGDEDGLPDERPMHRLTLSAYWIDKYEVTNSQYRACVQSGVCTGPKDRRTFDDPQRAEHPVTNVTWTQARTFCQWSGKRLPTEAEWEKAARGTDGRRYSWGNSDEVIKSRRMSNDAKSANHETEAVGSQAADVSPYGVFDLVGNAWEWVKDWYADDYYAVSPVQDPQGPLLGSFRVLRGGDWSRGTLELRASYRGWDEMTYWGPTLGFRCAADVD